MAGAAPSPPLPPGRGGPRSVTLEPARTTVRGDLTTNAALVHGASYPGGSRALAEALARHLAGDPLVDAAEPATTGFVNLTLSAAGLASATAAALARDDAFGRGTGSGGIDLAVPPVAGRPPALLPLDRARAVVVAEALASLLSAAGHDVRLRWESDLLAARGDLERLGCRLAASDPETAPGRHALRIDVRTAPAAPSAARAETVAVGPCRLAAGAGVGDPARPATLREVLSLGEADAIRFAMLARPRDLALDLDPAAVSERSYAAPLFAVRYAGARACRQSRAAVERPPDRDVSPAGLVEADLARLAAGGERDLLRRVALSPHVFSRAVTLREPQRLVLHLTGLAAAVHSQWNGSKDQPQLRFVNEEQRDLTIARWGLMTAVALVLKSGLGILGFSSPDEMR